MIVITHVVSSNSVTVSVRVRVDPSKISTKDSIPRIVWL